MRLVIMQGDMPGRETIGELFGRKVSETLATAEWFQKGRLQYSYGSTATDPLRHGIRGLMEVLDQPARQHGIWVCSSML